MSTLDDFIGRLPSGSDVAITGDGFHFEGQILARDERHLIICDGEGLQLVRVGAIDHINYCIPDTPAVIIR